MSFMTPSLPLPWSHLLEQVDRSSSVFWERRNYPPDPMRLQNMETWRELRGMLGRISSELIPETKMLAPVEIFLLHAAACLYEIGWQTSYALQLPLKQRYIESACLIRNSTRPNPKLELSYLETPTLNALACISAALSLDNLSVLPLAPEPVGYGRTASLRYLSALFQLADYLFIHRVNKRTIPNFADNETLDPLNARLLLQPYLPFIYIQPDGVTASFELHPDDNHLATKMNELFADPICLWWEQNASWLQENFQFPFILHPPRRKVIQNAAAPEPLARINKAVITFLEQYNPQISGKPNPSIEKSSTSTLYGSPTSDPQKSTTWKQAENTSSIRTRAFISYSHKDRKYLEELRIHLKPYNVDVWDATQIPAGAKWKEEIHHALNATKVAVLLVSADFLASDFIDKNELPPLLAAAEQEGTIILPVIIGPCAFKRSLLAKFQAVNSPDKPLKLMNRSAERDIVWNQVAELIKDAITETL